MSHKLIAELIDNLSLLLTLPLLILIRYYFYKNFLGFKKKTCWFILLSLILIIVTISNSILKVDAPFEITYDIGLLLSVCFLCYGNLIIKLYAILVEYTILLLFNLIILPFDFWVTPLIHNANITFNQHMIVNFLSINIETLLSYATLYIVLKKISTYIKIKDTNLSLTNSLYLFIPCLSTFGLAYIFYLIQKVKIGNSTYYLPNVSSKFYYFALPFICFLLLLSTPIIAYIYKNMLENEEQKQKYLLMEQQAALQLKHINNIENLYYNIRKVTHDINNHVSCLTALADNNNLKDIKQYLHNISDTVNRLDFKFRTGNPIADAIINEKYNISKAENIEFNCDFIIPSQININPIDLCTILGNSLDNAIEACKNINFSTLEKKISLKSYIRGMYLIIEVSNSTENKIQYFENKIVSTKSNKINHGIGLSNIKDVVKRYNGTLDLIEEKNKFILSLMLNIMT